MESLDNRSEVVYYFYGERVWIAMIVSAVSYKKDVLSYALKVMS